MAVAAVMPNGNCSDPMLPTPQPAYVLQHNASAQPGCMVRVMAVRKVGVQGMGHVCSTGGAGQAGLVMWVGGHVCKALWVNATAGRQGLRHAAWPAEHTRACSHA